jgi:S1-C subfamily serine protease
MMAATCSLQIAHVADPAAPFLKSKADRVLVVSSQGSYAYADVVARHQSLDLALLWVARRGRGPAFRQPITPYPKIAVGSSVFVIGHHQRLYFTLSSGLVSRISGDAIVQLSAPSARATVEGQRMTVLEIYWVS